MVAPETVDHAAIAARYTEEARALDEKAAMHKRIAEQYARSRDVPGQGSRFRYLATFWDKMAVRYTHSAEQARELAKMHRELVGSSST